MKPDFRISGRVIEKESGRELPGLFVRAYDKDLLFDDLVGAATTDERGHFLIAYSESDFRELFERRPDLYFVVSTGQGAPPIHSTVDHVRWNAGKDEHIEILIPEHKLPPGGAGPESVELLDAQGRRVTELEAGDSLLVAVGALEPNRSYGVRLLDAEKREILTVCLVANRFGVIAPTVLWPDIGIGLPGEGGRYAFETYEDAQKALGGQTLTLEILDDGQVKRTGRIRFGQAL